MSIHNWQLKAAISAIAFDCDGTLSAIEGIDELARNKGTMNQVKALTHKAMAKTGITPEIYGERLNLIVPHRDDIIAIGKQYYQQKVPDIEMVIQILLRLQKSIYIISAGILPAVSLFAKSLHIQAEHVFAVDMFFDEDGCFVDYDRNSPLIHNHGKGRVVENIKQTHPEMIYVGDGLNDLSARAHVRRFVGYGGAFYRKHIKEQCEFYISTQSMAPLLPLTLTEQESHALLPHEKLIYDKGLTAILNGEV